MAAVARDQLPANDSRIACGDQVREPLQHQPRQVQRVLRDLLTAPDPFQAQKAGVNLLDPPADLAVLEQGQDLGLQLRGREEDRQVSGHVVEQLRQEPTGVLGADALEQAALPQPGLDLPAGGDQGVEIGRVDGDVDDHLVLHGVMQQEVAAVGHDRVGFREGAEDVGVDLEPQQAPAEEPERDRQGQGQETPVQGQ